MPDPHERFWERFKARVKLGGRRLYESRLRTLEWAGEGGVKLSEAEKTELGQRAYDDPTGAMFEEILENRRKANKLEGTTEIPMDWWIWAKDLEVKRQEQGG